MTISSTRFRNSGRKWWRSSSITRARVTSSMFSLPSIPSMRAWLADVGGHDEHRVLEVHGAALAVGQPAVVEDLEQDVEHVVVGLLDLVEQHDRVGPAAHRLRELAALLVAHVPRGRADEPGHRVLLHVLGHVDADERVLVVEEELGQGPGGLRLPDAGGAEEDERADGPVGVLEPAAGAADGVAHRLDRRPLPDDALLEPLLHVDQLLDLGFHEAAHRDVGPLGHDLGDVLGVHLLLEEALLLLQLSERRVLLLQLLLEAGEDAELDLRRLVQVGLTLGGGLVGPGLLDPLLDRPDLLDGGLLRLPVGLQLAELLVRSARDRSIS